jgi:hypothetical protein
MRDDGDQGVVPKDLREVASRHSSSYEDSQSIESSNNLLGERRKAMLIVLPDECTLSARKRSGEVTDEVTRARIVQDREVVLVAGNRYGERDIVERYLHRH